MKHLQFVTPLLGALVIAAWGSSSAFAEGWPPVAPMDWSTVKVDDFADDELEVPYLLQHFHTVANAVVETGPTRGFLGISVNRDPKDNQPYNARILENNLSLAYFYATKRPWNPYYGSDAVKVRLEAMLEYWCDIQHPETGLFAEYSPTNFSLAPTGFGVAHMSRTLELLTSGGPGIDPAILERTKKAQRKAVLALLTRDDVFEWTHSWSNQHVGVLRAALQLLKQDPKDVELRAALLKGAARAVKVSQSPAGFLYEAAGSDVGYSSVHERFTGYAYHLIEKDAALRAILEPSEALWGKWLSHNLVLETPEPLAYLVNAATNTRTSHAVQTPRLAEQAKDQPTWRAFQTTDQEWASQLAKKRETLQKTWPSFKPLAVPSPYAYAPTALFTASTGFKPFVVTQQERQEAISRLPYLAEKTFTRQAFDPRRSWAFTFIRRPSYYAAFTSGKPQSRQTFGLGLLWNDTMGTLLQGVAGTDFVCGTLAADGHAASESADVQATLRAGGKSVTPTGGWKDLPAGELIASYNVGESGKKTVRFGDENISVSVERPGELVELLPLVLRESDRVEVQDTAVRVIRGSSTFSIALKEGVKASLGDSSPLSGNLPGWKRAVLRLNATDRLDYDLTVSPGK